jgi:hypothetical protein
MLVHYSLLGGVVFGDVGLLVLLMLQGIYHYSRDFSFFCNSFSFFDCVHPYCH